MCTNTSSFRRVTYVILVLSCPLLVGAGNFAGGTGRADDPYRIATAEQLISIGTTPTLTKNHFVLLNDLDLDPNLPGGRVFDGAVIASGASAWPDPFTGSFEGGRHTIRNLVIRAKSQTFWMLTSAGLFGRIGDKGVVRDLRIEAADVQVLDRRVGILAGENAGRIINCQVGGRVSSNMASFHADEVGGLAGRNTGNIINCQADMDWVWGHKCVGGLAGSNFSEGGTILGCRATCKQACAYDDGVGGLVGVNHGYIIGSAAGGGILAPGGSWTHGGLVGQNFGTILNCQAGSGIMATAPCAGFGGLVCVNQGLIADCYASGSITAADRCYTIGGLVGGNLPGGRVVNSYAVGKISTGADAKYVGGLVGLDSGGGVEQSFWDVETSGLRTSADGQGLTTAQMQQADTFLEAGWDFENTWTICGGKDYPRLQWEKIDCDQP